jgi:ribulose-5-phosphate 4-epimerase/fuculose-1-phosphate aldolase
MDGKKTSAEQAREQAEQATLGSMLDGAFGAMDGIEGPPEPETQSSEPEETETPDQTVPLNISTTESGPTGPPTGPPSGPPSEAPGPTGPPTGPPSGPPSEAPGPTGPPTGPPSGPPSEAPGPTGPPTGPPSDPPSEAPGLVEEVVTQESTPDVLVEQPAVESEPTSEPNHEVEQEHTPVVEEPTDLPEEVPEPVTIQTDEPQPMEQPVEEMEQVSSSIEEPANQEEIARLTAEIERLRSGLVGAAEVIEELEETPMPPIVFDNIVVAPHLVADFARMGRQLNQANLVKGSMGSMSMLHPDEPGLMISTRHSTSLARLDERGIVGGRLGGTPPRGSIADWKVHEVLLASVSVVTGGPAAAIHMHGPYTTAASCEKDLIIVQPIDVIGKEQIGKVVIVDPDGMDTEFLRQVAEALNQGGLRCVVVRGHGAYAVGANLDQAMANAAMLEHSMQILLLARQANLKF